MVLEACSREDEIPAAFTISVFSQKQANASTGAMRKVLKEAHDASA